MTDRLITEDRVPLVKLAAELGVDRKTVVRWADEGYRGQRLESYRIGKKRYSTNEAAHRFVAAMNCEHGDAAIGSAGQGPQVPAMLGTDEHTI